MEPSKVAPYFGTPEAPECHLLYNVTTMATIWHTVATQDVRLLRRQLDILRTLPKSQVFLNYLRCHDDIGWGLDYPTLRSYGMEEVPHKQYLNDYFRGYTGSASRGELYNEDPVTKDARFCGTTASMCGVGQENFRAEGVRLDLMLHGLMLFQSGIPVLYSGDEIGQLNDDSYHNDPNKAADSRYIHRGKMLWEQADQIDDKKTVAGQMFAGLRGLEEQRKEHKAFSADADVWTWDTGSDRVLGLGRYCDGEKLLGVFNFGEEAARILLPLGATENLLTGVQCARTISIPARDFLWLKQEV